ncbi:MAG: hypothetical protein Q8Q49_01395 [bacterium]|nr:hypothetical protein [bacterium]
MYKKLIGTGAAGLVGLALAVGIAFAAAGDPVQPPISPPGPAGAGCSGIGVAFDGTDILYTCSGESAIRKTDLTGADNGVVATADAAGAPVSVDAIAWDTNENKLWGGDIGPDAAGVSACRIWSIDMSTGVATLRFSFVDPHGGCDLSFFDGLTVDTVTDTLYLSPDVHKYIHHYKKDGTLAGNDPIDFETLTSAPADVCPLTEPFPNPDPVQGCNNSGLTIGLDGTLFAGTNGDSKIVMVDPVAKAFLGVFSTVDGRDEDLECGPVVKGLETILSREFFTGAIAVLEAPEGTCVSPVVPPEITLDPKTASNPSGSDHTVTATVTQGGNPLSGVLVSFSVVAGPNAGQVSDPGECSVDPNCNTDAAGQTSWTYTSNGTVGTDVIEACFTDENGEKHCVRVEKEWESLPGRMTGGGTIPVGITTLEGKHGFELHCDVADLPNRLEVNWGKGNKFHLESLTTAVCSDTALDEQQPVAGFDTYKGTGTGRLNGVSGATAKWVFTDDGEPGVNDTARIVISDGVNTYTFSGDLKNGNHQAHPDL